jgi:alpha-D-ribose 1-methylphosphonate 5-triphosphate synthase subunit PhnI
LAYFAVKGGIDAIANAKELVEYYRVKDQTRPVEIAQIQAQFRLAIDKIMGEGSLYAPEHAAIAFKQTEGDIHEAAFILRAFRATLDRRYYSEIIDTRGMFIMRRISSAFKDIPGGQVLGHTRDYTQRLLNVEIVHETEQTIQKFLEEFDAKIDRDDMKEVAKFDRVSDILKREGILKALEGEDRRVVDITRDAIKYPAPRSAVLQMMSRAETGSLMAFAYAGLRGQNIDAHGTVGELRVGRAEVRAKDNRGRVRYIGKIDVTECEMVSRISSSKKGAIPHLAIGYGLCFGHNESKAISMGLLDVSMRNPKDKAIKQEFVLYHSEGIESMGFVNHLKLPHYVTFQAGLNTLRSAIKRMVKRAEKFGVSRPAPMRVSRGTVKKEV